MSARKLTPRRLGRAIVVASLMVASAGAAEDVVEDSTEVPGLDKVDDITELSLLDLLQTPTVESASRRKQSLDDAPASITQFEADEIIGAGIVTMADILRRVPGLFVFERKAKNFDVGLRGNYRVLLLVDGRLVAATDDTPFWDAFFFHVGEIERIEVLRGPGSIVFGANGLSGVINIVTKQPIGQAPVEATAASGLSVLPNQPDDGKGRRIRGLGNGFASVTWTNPRQSLGVKMTLAAGQMPEWIDLPAPAKSPHGDFSFHGALTFDYRPGKNTALFLDLRHGQNEAIQNLGTTFYESHQASSATLTFRRLGLLPSVDLHAVADAQRVDNIDNGIALDGTNELRLTPSMTSLHGLLQLDASQLDERNTVSLAGEASYVSTDGFFGAGADTLKTAVVLQNQTVVLPRPRLVLSVGGRLERVGVDSSNRTSVSYVHFAPRLSLSLALSDKHSLRGIVTTAYRTPDLVQTYIDVALPGVYEPPTSPPVVFRANPWLKPEEMVSAEIGYQGHPWRWIRIDATAFLQRLHNRIDYIRSSLPAFQENAPDDWQSGVELGLKLRPVQGHGGYISYAYVHSTRRAPNAFMGFPSNLLSVGFDSRWRDLRLNIDFHWFSRFDSAQLDMSDSGVILSRRRTNPEPMLNLRIGRTVQRMGVELFASARNLLALGRDIRSVTVLPDTWANPIGATFLMGLGVPTR